MLAGRQADTETEKKTNDPRTDEPTLRPPARFEKISSCSSHLKMKHRIELMVGCSFTEKKKKNQKRARRKFVAF